MRPIGTAGKGPLTCEKYNASIVVGDHAMDDSSGAIESPVEDNATHLLPVLQSQFRERLMGTNRGIIDKDVDTAKFRQGARHHIIDLLSLGDIGQQRQGLAAASTDLLSDCV